jgi:hypothetical protein
MPMLILPGMIDRTEGKSSIENKIISQIKIEIPTYEENNLPDYLKSIKAVKPGSRGI